MTTDPTTTLITASLALMRGALADLAQRNVGAYDLTRLAQHAVEAEWRAAMAARYPRTGTPR